MSIVSGKRLMRSVAYIPIEDISPAPMQPRVSFDEEGLEELAASISRHGVLQPLTVRIKGRHFELIAGERRLRASKMAGLSEVPCIIMDVDMEKSGIIALIENIQRSDFDFVEEAKGINRLIRLFDMSQDEAAKTLGKSQSAVANKLRILKLPPDVLNTLRTAKLSERHARALLRLDTVSAQRDALDFIIDQRMNVAQTEEYIDRLTQTQAKAAPEEPLKRKSVFVMKDLRLFFNTINHSVDLVRQSGINAELLHDENDEDYVLTIIIPKNKKPHLE